MSVARLLMMMIIIIIIVEELGHAKFWVSYNITS